IVLGAYIWDRNPATRLTDMTPEKRRQAAINDGERLHPGYGKLVGPAVSVAWSKIPYSLGGWAEWGSFPGTRSAAYPKLLAGDRAIGAATACDRSRSWSSRAGAVSARCRSPLPCPRRARPWPHRGTASRA